MGTLETEVARHIATVIDGSYAHGVMFTASANGPLIHLTTQTQGEDRKDAWVLTVEWDGER